MDMLEMHDQSNKLMAFSSSHMTSRETMTHWHAVRATWEQNDPLWSQCFTDHSVCRTTNSKGHGATVHLEGHVPGSHIYSFFQFLGLSRGSFTLQATLTQNVVEHLNQESRKVLKRTGESSGTCLTLLTTSSTTIYTICDFPHSTELCIMKAATDSCKLQEGPHHFWNSMGVASNSTAALHVGGAETGTVANPNPQLHEKNQPARSAKTNTVKSPGTGLARLARERWDKLEVTTTSCFWAQRHSCPLLWG